MEEKDRAINGKEHGILGRICCYRFSDVGNRGWVSVGIGFGIGFGGVCVSPDPYVEVLTPDVMGLWGAD